MAAYLAEQPSDRQDTLRAVRAVILASLPVGFEEGMQYGMIGYYVPLTRFPDTYNGQPLGITALANQKRYMPLYLSGVYSHPDEMAWFRDRWISSGKKLDMGKSCVRLRAVACGFVGSTTYRWTWWVRPFLARRSTTSLLPTRKAGADRSGRVCEAWGHYGANR